MVRDFVIKQKVCMYPVFLLTSVPAGDAVAPDDPPRGLDAGRDGLHARNRRHASRHGPDVGHASRRDHQGSANAANPSNGHHGPPLPRGGARPLHGIESRAR